MEVYAYELEQLLMCAIPTCTESEQSKDVMLRHQFIQGMPSTLKEKLLSSSVVMQSTKFRDITQMAKQFILNGQSSVDVNIVNQSSSNMERKLEDLLGKMNEMTGEIAKLKVETEYRSSMGRGRGLARGRRDLRNCYNCGQTGHLARNCESQSYCYRCGDSGHISTQCRVPLGIGQRNQGNY